MVYLFIQKVVAACFFVQAIAESTVSALSIKEVSPGHIFMDIAHGGFHLFVGKDTREKSEGMYLIDVFPPPCQFAAFS